MQRNPFEHGALPVSHNNLSYTTREVTLCEKVNNLMKCQDFQDLIPEFIEDTLNEEYYEGFAHHAKSCSNCLDELEIHYMIRVGLERIESDATKSFDIQGELKDQLLYYEHKADSIFMHGIYKKLVFIIAESCTALLLIIQILVWFGIL